MKVTYVITGNGLSPKLGGSVIRTLEVAKRLQKKNVEIQVVTTVGGKTACLNNGLKCKFVIIPCHYKNREEGLLDRIVSNVITLIVFPIFIGKVDKAEIIYSDSDYLWDVLPAATLKLVGKGKWVSMIHHKIAITHRNLKDIIITTSSKFLQNLSLFIISKFSDKIFVYESEMGEKIKLELIKMGVKNDSIIKVNNGVSFELIKQIRKGRENYDACYIAGLRPNKGLYDIVPLWKRVVIKNPLARLAIIGEVSAEYQQYIKEEIEKNRLDSNILLFGGLEHKKALSILKASKLAISPSHEEGWGIFVCEALACNKKTVAYDLKVYEKFKPMLNTVKNYDINQFAEKVLMLLSAKTHEDNEKKLAKFDWEEIAKTELGIYEELVNAR